MSNILVPFPFLLLASYWKVLSESVSAYFGCLPPGGHGGREWEAHRTLVAVLCWSLSNTSSCLWLCPDAFVLIPYLWCPQKNKCQCEYFTAIFPDCRHLPPACSSGGGQQSARDWAAHPSPPRDGRSLFGQPKSREWQDLGCRRRSVNGVVIWNEREMLRNLVMGSPGVNSSHCACKT